MKKRVIIASVAILATVVSYGGHALMSARKIMLAAREGKRQVSVVQSAMTALGVPEYWQQQYLKIHYPMSSSSLEERGSRSATPKYAYVPSKP